MPLGLIFCWLCLTNASTRHLANVIIHMYAMQQFCLVMFILKFDLSGQKEVQNWDQCVSLTMVGQETFENGSQLPVFPWLWNKVFQFLLTISFLPLLRNGSHANTSLESLFIYCAHLWLWGKETEMTVIMNAASSNNVKCWFTWLTSSCL